MPERADKPYRDIFLQPPTQELSTDEIALLRDKARIITMDEVPQGTGGGTRRMRSRQHAEQNKRLNQTNILGLVLQCMEQPPDAPEYISAEEVLGEYDITNIYNVSREDRTVLAALVATHGKDNAGIREYLQTKGLNYANSRVDRRLQVAGSRLGIPARLHMGIAFKAAQFHGIVDENGEFLQPDPRTHPENKPFTPQDLSEEQLALLRLRARGLSYTEIAQKVIPSSSAIRHRGTAIFKALGVKTVKEALLMCFEAKVLDPNEFVDQEDLEIINSLSRRVKRSLKATFQIPEGTKRDAAHIAPSIIKPGESISYATLRNGLQAIHARFFAHDKPINSIRLWVIAYVADKQGLLEEE